MADAKKYIVGNWKMHGSLASAAKLAGDVLAFTQDGQTMEFLCPKAFHDGCIDIVLCPPALHIRKLGKVLKGSKIHIGAQDCATEAEGAHTGDISAPMLKDVGCSYVIVGHSERRAQHGESSALVAKKAQAAMQAGLKPIICIGETESERQSGQAEAVVGKQLRESIPSPLGGGLGWGRDNIPAHNAPHLTSPLQGEEPKFLLAYEPVWAIGSGQTPTKDDIGRMHAYILSVAKAPVLYGGSVKAANAREILAIKGVSGVLVGGASLKAEEFCRIIEAAQ